MAGKPQHVVSRKGGGWAVKGEGNGRATVVQPTQQKAIEAAKTIARNQHTEVVIHGRNGQIRAKDSYGSDPFPPKG